MSIFKPTYLYVKTHNITGLKYFGKTVRKDPFSYYGSGTRWIYHLKKHGYDISTEIIGLFSNEEECRQVALDFSVNNNIVKSNKWANLKMEKIEGGWDHITSDHIKKGIEKFRQRPVEEQQEINKSKGRIGNKNGMFGSARFGEKNPMFGKKMTEEQKDKFGRRNKGKTVGINADGEKFQINCDDHRFKTGELKSIHTNKLIVKDINGNKFAIDKNDQRYLNGEVTSINTGKHRTQQEKDNLSKIVSTLKWYNNGVTTKRFQTPPSEDWIKGRLKMSRSPK